MDASAVPSPIEFTIGSAVLYKPRRADFFQARYAGKQATIVWCPVSSSGAYYYIEFPCGSILVASEGDLEQAD